MAVIGGNLVIRNAAGTVRVGRIGGRGRMSAADAMKLCQLWNAATPGNKI